MSSTTINPILNGSKCDRSISIRVYEQCQTFMFRSTDPDIRTGYFALMTIHVTKWLCASDIVRIHLPSFTSNTRIVLSSEQLMTYLPLG